MPSDGDGFVPFLPAAVAAAAGKMCLALDVNLRSEAPADMLSWAWERRVVNCGQAAAMARRDCRVRQAGSGGEIRDTGPLLLCYE